MKDITSLHPRYEQFIGLWTKARDFFEGEDKVKEKGSNYLPKSNDDWQPGESAKYESYKSRAYFYEATSRTVEGLVGLATHKPAVLEIPVAMQHPDEYMPGDTTVDVMVQDIIRENIITSRQGILIDRGLSAVNLPYMVQYTAEQITNWHFNGDVLQFVVLMETYAAYDEKDPYNTTEETQYRELRMIDGAYTQNIWRKERGRYTIQDTIVPTKKGVPLDHIPFIFTSRAKLGPQVDKSPIQGMVNANCHHYQLNADYAHALHYVACPTLAMYGVNDDGEDTTVGSDVVLKFSSEGAKAEYVEISGKGLPSMENALASIEDRMAHLGSRLLQSRRAGIESAEAIRLTQSAETSSLMSIVMVAEQALQAAFDEIVEWEGISQYIEVKLNRDFVDVTLPPGEVDSLVKAYQAKTISLETLLFNLQRGELLSEDVTIEDEIARISATIPEAEELVIPEAEESDI